MIAFSRNSLCYEVISFITLTSWVYVIKKHKKVRVNVYVLMRTFSYFTKKSKISSKIV